MAEEHKSTPADDAGVLDFGRAYFERGFIAAYAWAATKLPSSQLSDAVIDRAWDHRDEGMDGDDMLPVQQPAAHPIPIGYDGFAWCSPVNGRLPHLPDGMVYGWRTKGGHIYMGDVYPVPARRFALDPENCDAILICAYPPAATPSVATPADDVGVPLAALPESIGRLRLGDRRSDGDHLCSHNHDVPAGHPLYWPERMGEYPDDVDPLCLAHAIEQAESESGFCATCAAAEFGPADDAEVTQADRDAAARHCLPRNRADNMRAGLMDDDLLVREFASHRLAASPKAPAVAIDDGDPDGWLAVKVNSEGGIVMPYGPLHSGPDRPSDTRYRWAPFYLGEPR